MKKLLIIIYSLFNLSFLFGNANALEKARQKYNDANAISYTTTAFYPNPDTDEVTSFSISYIINNLKNNSFDFYSKKGNLEEFYVNKDYSNVNRDEKTIYKYELEENLSEAILSNNFMKYGPYFLLKNNWQYESDVTIDGKVFSHFSFLESTRKYETKIIKAVFHIYISPDYTISKFERKSYVDDKLGQTVTYNYDNYLFSKDNIGLKSEIPNNFGLKYYERLEALEPLEKNAMAPAFEAKDINNNQISSDYFKGKKTLLLFSKTDCGASSDINLFLKSINYNLPDNLNLVDVFGSDTEEIVKKYFRNTKVNFPIITNQKELETDYGISSYPILYLIDEKGIISDVLNGSEQIIQFLKTNK